MSLTTVAGLARIDVAHLSRVERGRRSLSVDALYRLAVVLDLKELAGLLSLYERGGQS